jgi:hypothetical protein
MLKVLANIPETDPLANPEQRAIVEQILEENIQCLGRYTHSGDGLRCQALAGKLRIRSRFWL